MKICLINNLYKPYARGGAERIAEMIGGGLSKRGDEVVVISTKPLFDQRPAASEKFSRAEDLGGEQKIYYLPSLYYNLNKFPIFLRLFWHIIDMFDLANFLRVRLILKKEKPDMVMTHNLKGIGYLIPLLIKNLKIKHLHILHDIQLIHPSGLQIFGEEKLTDGFFAKIYQVVCRFLFSSPDVVISPSKWLLDFHIKREFFSDSKKVILRNPINLAITKSQIKNFKSEIFKFLYVGQIEAHKGILFLIEVFKEIPFKDSRGFKLECELLIVGDGSESEEAKRIAAGSGNIKFLGKKNKEEVENLMQGADCLIIPSLCYENSPTVIYEAAAAGLPVIGSDLGGISELLSSGAGVLFKPEDKKDLINKIKWALKNREELKKMGEAANREINGLKSEDYFDCILL